MGLLFNATGLWCSTAGLMPQVARTVMLGIVVLSRRARCTGAHACGQLLYTLNMFLDNCARD